MSIEFDHKTLGQRVVFGSGKAAVNTIAQVHALRAQRALLIADAFAVELADEIASGVSIVARVGEVAQHVPVENAGRATDAARGAGADAIVSIGGGSATGLAKAVALQTGLPIVAVPTTFAGSEATDVWGLTEAERKTTGTDPRVLPAVVVYDAALLAGLPVRLAVASGLNAIAHAIDGFWAPRADPINRALGAEGLRALVPGLRALHADAGAGEGTGAARLEALEQTLYGAYLAAVAFASAGSGMHHKICHVLGGRFGLPHAELHSVVLGYVTAFNAPAAPDAAERISVAFGGLPAQDAPFAFRAELGAPMSLAELGLAESALPEAAALCLDAIPPSNPRTVTRAEVEQLLRLAWAGEPLSEGQL